MQTRPPTSVEQSVIRWIDHHLPERQVLVRERGQVHYFVLGAFQQVIVGSALIGCLAWAIIATIAYVETAKEMKALSRQTSQLNQMRSSCQTTLGQFEEFQTSFSRITGEVSAIQDRLLRLTERETKQAPPARIPPSEIDTEPLRHDVAQLEGAFGAMQASHKAFLEQSASLAGRDINRLERVLTSVGLSARTIPGDPFGRGGPFVPAPPGLATTVSYNPAALQEARTERLDALTRAMKPLPFAAPLASYELMSPFGARNDPINAQTGIHEGIDLGAPAGTPVMATGDGIVTWSAPSDRYGNLVEIEHPMGLSTRYAHLSKLLVHPGDIVRRGAIIGFLGDTGRTTGPHLHYEVRIGERATNPLKFIMAGRDVLKAQ